ncbi:MAG: hypothetical protein ABI821_01160 [Pseudomonadota bacterium]
MSSSQIASCNSLANPLCGSLPAAPVQKDNSARQIQQALRAGVAHALGVKGAGHGLHGLAAALQRSLANADPGAADPVLSMLETIGQGLDTAAKKLADRGVDPQTIDAAIKLFRSDLARELDSLAPAAPPGNTGAAAVHAVTKEKFSLSILTAEGDRVSIRFRSSNVTDVAAAQTRGTDGTATAIDAHVISRGRLKIEVQGDLNDDELAAIGDLLDKVDRIASDFFAGDVLAAFDAASRVDFDTQELSGFRLKLSYSQRIGFASTYAQAATPVSAPAPAPTPADPIASPAVAVAPGVISAPVPIEDAPIDTPAPTDSAPPAPTSSAQQTIASFAKVVLAKLATVEDVGQLQFSMRWKVDFLMNALAATGSAEARSAPATQALGAVLADRTRSAD